MVAGELDNGISAVQVTHGLSEVVFACDFLENVPRSLALFLAAVFCLFCSLSFIQDSLNVRALTPARIALNLFGGAFSALWAFIIMHRMLKSIIFLSVIQAVQIWWRLGIDRRTPKLLFDSDMFRQKLTTDAAVAMVTLLGGYLLFILFIQREGQRFFSTYIEVKLAGEIHRNLVPKVSRQTAQFEFFGLSVPSGQVGGDLVDVVEEGGKWIAYVADISGHGIPAGVLMSMTKSAVHMRLACEEQNGQLLDDLNRVLTPITEPNMFITFAYASWAGGTDLQFGLAGHLPILHFRQSCSDVEELSLINLPLSIKADQKFKVGAVRFQLGDILAIVTDGLTEVFDSQDHEFGMEPLKLILAEKSGGTLEHIAMEMRSRALHFGKQSDDQTVMLLRRIG